MRKIGDHGRVFTCDNKNEVDRGNYDQRRCKKVVSRCD